MLIESEELKALIKEDIADLRLNDANETLRKTCELLNSTYKDFLKKIAELEAREGKG